jgi:hypothetical protein
MQNPSSMTWMKFDIDASYHQPWNHPQGWTYNDIYMCYDMSTWNFNHMDYIWQCRWWCNIHTTRMKLCVDGIISFTYLWNATKWMGKILHGWNWTSWMTITYMDENWQHEMYDNWRRRLDQKKQMKLICHFHPCCEFHAYMSHFHVWVHPCVIKLVDVESSIYFINFIQILPNVIFIFVSHFFFKNVRVSFICHQFIHVEKFCLFHPKFSSK